MKIKNLSDLQQIKIIINDTVRIYEQLLMIEKSNPGNIDPKSIEEINRLIRQFWAELPAEEHNKMGMKTLKTIEKLGLTIADSDEDL